MLKDLRNYILEDTFKISVYKDTVDIINYLEIDHFDDNKILVRYEKGTVSINGKNLIIIKLLDDEILINGKIEKIDFK